MAEKDTNGKRPSEEHEKDSNESIPLWLQGLDENDKPDQTEPFSPPVEESPEDFDEEDADSEPSVGPADDIEVLPDWLDEIVAEDEPTALESKQDEVALETGQPDEPTDEVFIEQTEPQEESVIESEEEPEVDKEPFVELSDMGMEDEMLSEEEDLPDWLTDMITEEPEEEETTGDEAEEVEQSLTAEVESDAGDLDDGAGWQRLEEMPADWVSFDDSTPVNQPEDETPDWLIDESEEDTSPIKLSEPAVEEIEEEAVVDEIKSVKPAQEDTGHFVPIEPIEMPEPEPQLPEPEASVADERESHEAKAEPEEARGESGDSIPKALRFAKFILDQGEVDRAMEIISTHIGQSNYLPEIEGWITEAIDKGVQPNAGLWEAVGDIAVVQEDYARALNAYSKSMEVLMHLEEGN
jgi:hypothetical protein